jgi:dihydrofolate reductase
VLYGSADLLNSLIKHDLVDEYRIMVFPVVLGSGKTPVPRCGGIWGVPSRSRERPHNNE